MFSDTGFANTINMSGVNSINWARIVAQTVYYFSWGRGKDCGTMVYKCKSDDFGMVPLFHITTNGQIKFQLNYMRTNIAKKEIVRDFQLKLESNFLMDFDEDEYPFDLFHEIDDLFNIKHEVEKFEDTIQGISARLKQ